MWRARKCGLEITELDLIASRQDLGHNKLNGYKEFLILLQIKVIYAMEKKVQSPCLVPLGRDLRSHVICQNPFDLIVLPKALHLVGLTDEHHSSGNI